MMSDDDDQQAAAWVVLIGVVLLAVGLAVGVGLQRSLKATGADGATPVLTAATQAGAASTADAGSAAAGSDAPAAAQPSDAEASDAVAAGADSTAADASADGAQADGTTADASQVAAGEASASSDAQQTADAAAEGPSVRVDGEVVTFYFATARADLAEGAHDALADIIKGVAIGRTAVVSGFHDPTGDLASNQELAKQRAQAVAEALRSLGVGEDKIELRKPEQSEVDGVNLAQARRVEVVLE